MKTNKLFIGLIMLTITGCDAFFRRQPLSETEFIARYLPEIPTSAVTRLDLQQQGGVGGRMFVARVEVSNAAALSVIGKLHREHVLDLSGDTDGSAKEYLDAAFRSALGPAPPAWAIIPQATNVTIYADSLGDSFRKVYTFDTLPMVFVFAGER